MLNLLKKAWNKQTTAQFAKDFIDQQYAFLYDICKQEAKYKPWYDVYNLQQLPLLCAIISPNLFDKTIKNIYLFTDLSTFNLSFCAAI